jgi:hypothetical protein
MPVKEPLSVQRPGLFLAVEGGIGVITELCREKSKREVFIAPEKKVLFKLVVGIR